MVAFLVLLPCSFAFAQTSTTEFLPEIDANFKLNSYVRFVFQAKDTREGGDPTQAEIGPSIEFYLKPLLKLKNVTVFDLDDAKSRPLVLAVGYRVVPSHGQAHNKSDGTGPTFHVPITARILITDRNRADLDWSARQVRLALSQPVDRRTALHDPDYHPAPYVSAEMFYESQYSKISSTNLYAGCLLPVGKHIEFDPYYEHENNTGKRPNQQVNAVGLILDVFF